MSQDEALDEVWAFFMNCFHLRDWIINSGWKSKAAVDAFTAATPDVKLCGDICNGLKHFRVDPKRVWSASNSDWTTASMATYSFPPGSGDRPESISSQWVFTTDGTVVDMFDLADRCVAAWDRFLAG
jgi:hypothetical protein